MNVPADKPTFGHAPVVLVVDDDEVSRMLLQENLPDSARSIELASPIGATRTAIDNNIDVLVLDYDMPNLRGDLLTKLFRNTPRLAHVGIVLVSAARPEVLAELAATSGADRVLSKAHVRKELAEVVARSCRLARTRARQGAAPADVP